MGIIFDELEGGNCPDRRLYGQGGLSPEAQEALGKMIAVDCEWLCAKSDWKEGVGQLPCRTVSRAIEIENSISDTRVNLVAG